jgi:uncharacterized protein (TIGR03905 family)
VRHKVKPKIICPKALEFDVEEGRVKNVQFTGGCHGNLQGLSRLSEGRDALELAGILAGIRCRSKPTSCPNELSRALLRAMGQKPPRLPRVKAPKPEDPKAEDPKAEDPKPEAPKPKAPKPKAPKPEAPKPKAGPPTAKGNEAKAPKAKARP